MKTNLKKQGIIPLLLILADIVALALAFFIAYILRNLGPFRIFLLEVQPIKVYLTALPFAVIFLVIIFYIRGLYKPKQRLTAMGELYLVSQSITLWILIIMAGSYLVKYDYSRIIIVLFWLISLVSVNGGRWLIGMLQQKLARRGFWLTNIIIVGTGRPGKTIAEQLTKYQKHGFKIIGFVEKETERQSSLPILGSMQNLYNIIEQHQIDQIFFADPSLSYEQTLNLVHRCPFNNVEFKIASNIFPLISHVKDLNDIEAIPSLSLKRTSPSPVYHIGKRIFDVIIAVPLFFFLLLPLWFIVGLLIKRDSSGPILIKQSRVGKDGKIFTLYKFRTMKEGVALYAEAPLIKNDPRVTIMGRFLRKTSLDELPQLINVLKGEMSIVGPRPEMPFIVAQYSEWQKKRLSVKPGITGLWQILGRQDIPLSDNLEYDFYYINNQSLLLDIVIILKTIPPVLLGKGAY